MRFLGIGDTCDLAALYLKLAEDGHEVRVSVTEPMCQDILVGMVEHTPEWQRELPWLREAGDGGVILFENVAQERGALQDDLRRDGFHVVGGSAYGDRLENDRAYAQSVLAAIGLPVARMWEFDRLGPALRFLDANPARYVLKFSGPNHAASETYVGQLADGRDVAAMLHAGFSNSGSRFILM